MAAAGFIVRDWPQQQAISITSTAQRSSEIGRLVLTAFLNNHRVGMVVFMGIALDYLLLG